MSKFTRVKVTFLCNECGHVFWRAWRNLDKLGEVRCPKCKGYDTEPH